jgi:hypothetical protein
VAVRLKWPDSVRLFLAFRANHASLHSDTSLRVDGTSGSLALWILPDPVARVACGSISSSADRCFANALWTGNECCSNEHQCRLNARDRNAVLSAPCEPDVARWNFANAIAAVGRPSPARAV